jgi:hypothetical protein
MRGARRPRPDARSRILAAALFPFTFIPAARDRAHSP